MRAPWTPGTFLRSSTHGHNRQLHRGQWDLLTRLAGQGELFKSWRYHPVFTDSPFTMLQAELQHRQHAVIEQVFADGKSGPLAHLPSGNFQTNNAWLTLRAIAFNLLRAAGKPTLRLPDRWPWQHASCTDKNPLRFSQRNDLVRGLGPGDPASRDESAASGGRTVEPVTEEDF